MKLSNTATIIGDSPTLKLNAKVAALRKDGKPIVHLGGGEPEFPAPIAAVEALVKKAQSRKIKYSPASGTPELKKAVTKFTKDVYGVDVENKNVVISVGAKQAIYDFLLCTVNPGDEVIYPVPYWVSYPEMIKLVGGIPVEAKPSKGLQITLEDLLKKVTSKTKAIMINTPNNPSGLIYSESFIKGIVEFCEQKNIWLLTDDIYNRLVFDNGNYVSPFKYAKNPQNILAVNGVSKVYGLTGLRIGWGVSYNTELIAAMGRMQAQTTSCNSSLCEAGALGALEGDQGVIEELRKNLEHNRNVLLGELAKIKDIEVFTPQGTFYSFVNISKYNKSSMAFAEFLLDKVLLSVVPGANFGVDGYVRISYCASEENIREGLRRLIWALDKNATEPIEIGGKLVKKDW